AQSRIKGGDDIFKFPGLRVTAETEESKRIFGEPNPKIIIAGSGMSNGGRIIHHEKHYLPDPDSTLLLIGYQSVGTLGRLIEDGEKEVRINGEMISIKAKIEKISGYSGHKDSDHLIEFVEKMADKVKRVYVAMGEPKSSLFLAQRLRDYLGVEAYAPEQGQVVELEC
ncbi:MAG: metallo-beta-lactamase family protein, partial [Patescibacteria group bacterium]|nr:metallo-beta-lactamase family protein [Patescibacteria group bacterium]